MGRQGIYDSGFWGGGSGGLGTAIDGYTADGEESDRFLPSVGEGGRRAVRSADKLHIPSYTEKPR